MPALQVVDVMLATLGSKHTTVALEDLCSDLAETLKQISDISAELARLL
jgi:hypothetical protein